MQHLVTYFQVKRRSRSFNCWKSFSMASFERSTYSFRIWIQKNQENASNWIFNESIASKFYSGFPWFYKSWHIFSPSLTANGFRIHSSWERLNFLSDLVRWVWTRGFNFYKFIIIFFQNFLSTLTNSSLLSQGFSESVICFCKFRGLSQLWKMSASEPWREVFRPLNSQTNTINRIEEQATSFPNSGDKSDNQIPVETRVRLFWSQLVLESS